MGQNCKLTKRLRFYDKKEGSKEPFLIFTGGSAYKNVKIERWIMLKKLLKC